MLEKQITDSIIDNYMPYTAHVIIDRALPEIDGFKPSQRRILYTMYKMGLSKGGRKKSQGVVGSTMFLHPHGDSAIYETLVRMTKDAESFRIPMIDSKGNFGKQFSRDMQYASARYTEVRLAEITKELFKDIDKNTVDMIDNYDGTLKEPKLLPVSYPAILTNPQSGIANGMASNIAPFNLREVIDFTIAYIKNPKEAKVSDYILAPDFPTGASVIYDKKKLETIFEKGQGSVVMRATYKIDGNSIVFDEIPYTTTYEVIMDKIAEHVKDGKLKEVVDINNILGIKTRGIEVVAKNNTNMELLVEKLFKLTPLQTTFGCNFNIILDGKPRVLGVKQIVHEWIGFRVKTIKRGFQHEIDKKEAKKHNLIGLKKVMLDINKAIKIINETKKSADVIENLMIHFDIDKSQAEYIAEIKLRSLNKEHLIQRTDEIKTLESEINNLNKMITSRTKLALYLIEQLQDIKKAYGEERKTKIIELDEIPSVDIAKVDIPNYNVKTIITKDGYLKKLPLTSLRGNYTIKIKEDDVIVNEIDTTNNADVLVFTDKRNVYKYKLHEVEDHKPSSLGEYLPSLLNLKDENILFVTVTNDYIGNLIIGFEDGKIAKIELKAYETKQNRAMLKNAYADKKALYFNHIKEDIDMVALSSIDKVAVFNTSLINPKTSKTTIGIQILKSKNNSVAVYYGDVNNANMNDMEYYRINGAGVGKYLKKEDKINME